MADKYDINLKEQLDRTETLFCLLKENAVFYYENNGRAGSEYAKNHNASKTAILNQIKMIRNELLILREIIER